MVNKGKSKEKEMGLSSSSARYLFLTDRKHDLEYKAMRLSNEKVELSRDMNKITNDYQNALKVRRLKLSNNNGVSYTDLSYKTLMKPSIFNNYKPYFVSDSKGRIVLNTDYAKYAKQLGIPQSGGVDFDSLQGKDAVLSKLTGIDESKITNFYQAEKNVKDLQNEAFFYEGVYNYWQEQASVTYMSGDNFVDNLFETKKVVSDNQTYDISWLDTSLGDLAQIKYSDNEPDGDRSRRICELKNVLVKIIENNANRFSSNEYSEIINRINSIGAYYSDTENNNIDDKWHNCNLYGLGGYNFNITSNTTYREVLEKIIENAFKGTSYYKLIGTGNDNDRNYYCQYTKPAPLKNNNPSNLGYNYNLIDGNYFAFRDENWRNTYLNAEAAKGKYDEKYKAFQEALSEKNAMLSADEESSLQFYEDILRAICTNGWIENNQVNDPEYLDNMLQNNVYLMTTQTFKEGLIEYNDFADAGYLAASKKEGIKGYIAPGEEDAEGKNSLIAAKREEIDTMYKNGDYTPDSYSYTTRMAGDFDKLYTISDTDIQSEAEAAYANAKAIVKTKEQKLDTQIEKIKTEQSAITQMMQSIKQTMSSNMERMNVFTA